MSDKLKLLQIANKRAAGDCDFIAYYLVKYSEFERISEDEIMSNLNCTIENYFKLGLCRVPDVNSEDFINRLNNISEYSLVSTIELNRIIKRVNSLLMFSTDKDLINPPTYLMAARDRKKKDDDTNK